MTSNRNGEPSKQETGKTDSKAAQQSAEAKAIEKPAAPVKDKPAPKPSQPAAKPGKGKSIAWVVLLLMFLAALGAGGWWYYHYFYQQLELSQQLNQRLMDSQHSSQEQLQQLQSRLAEEQQSRQAETLVLQQSVDQLSNRLNSQSQRLRELSGTTRSDWLLAEAEYLIRLGMQRFITERNTTNSIALMESADAILSELDEVDLLSVRRTLARDITALRTIGNIDREGLYLKLDALAEVIVALPLIPRQPEAQTETAPVSVAAEIAWHQKLVENIYLALGKLQSLIRVQRRSGAIEPLLSLNEEAYIRHNLRFMLEQAQLALLREEPVVYRRSLEKAGQWLRDYFQLENQAQQLLVELEKLQQADIQTDYPVLSGGLQALRDFIDNRHNRYSVESASPGNLEEMQQ